MIFMIQELEELLKKIIRVKLFQGRFFEEAAEFLRNKQTNKRQLVFQRVSCLLYQQKETNNDLCIKPERKKRGT